MIVHCVNCHFHFQIHFVVCCSRRELLVVLVCPPCNSAYGLSRDAIKSVRRQPDTVLTSFTEKKLYCCFGKGHRWYSWFVLSCFLSLHSQSSGWAGLGNCLRQQILFQSVVKFARNFAKHLSRGNAAHQLGLWLEGLLRIVVVSENRQCSVLALPVA